MPQPGVRDVSTRLPEQFQRVIVNQVTPQVDEGRFPAKAVVGEEFPVGACVFSDGQPTLLVRARWRLGGDFAEKDAWQSIPLRGRIDDFWTGVIVFPAQGAARFQIEAWRDEFASWRSDFRRWLRAGADPSQDILTGLELVRSRAALLPERTQEKVRARLEALWDGPRPTLQNYLLAPGTLQLMQRALLDTPPVRSLELPVWVERPLALFGAWYEMFPRSEGSDGRRSGTFASAQARLPGVADMKFDVVYLPPIHPIGTTARRGRNNAPVARPAEPGSPWAIGSPAGDHRAINPELGNLHDFLRFRETAEKLGLEIALDYALQCSPDHPWVTEHPDWFVHRPDGTIRPAENPPKRYDDVFPIDFSCPDWPNLWRACYQVLEFWIEQGVKVFRVDNPHTKPVAFWAWVFTRLRAEHPDVILLAEAFTRPALMGELSKVGFSQSYTYFTWRSTKSELRTYMTQLTRITADYLRPNFFANTPDILTRELQEGGPAAFRYRLVLAATLSPAYGIYSGYELCENRPQSAHSEEYWDSEKYQFRPRDWNRPDSLAPLVTQLNQIRRTRPALQQLRRIDFHRTDNRQVLAYSKHTSDHSDVVLVVVNLDPKGVQTANVSLSLERLDIARHRPFRVLDLLSDSSWTWSGGRQEITLDPVLAPALILSVEQ